ncbi:GNAT family N-acetyltransferase [Microbacterium awajiense]|uniref:GNAT family N-acetyltransferase n=1 Tax=Microbacterium awajiense TaxID=415214 RepID=A0ABP7ANP2_9MICO
MTDDDAVAETERLVLRRWRVADAAVQRTLWAERDPRTPAHRRLSSDGHPTLEELEDRIRHESPGATVALLAAVRRTDGAVVGYAGLIRNDHGEPDEPEIAYEFLRAEWGRGLATEACGAVVDWARRTRHRRLWATVREWNTASRRVLDKVGFAETTRVDRDAAHGDTLYYRLDL